MLKLILSEFRPALAALVVFTVICGIIYPAVVTGVSQAVFSHKANGSFISKDGKTVGSELIGQSFSDPKYFWGRLSATGPYPYKADASSGSNLGPLNPTLQDNIKARIKDLQEADPGNTAPIPSDLVTASGSGLDPHISPAASAYQISRIAKFRKMEEAPLRRLVADYTEDRQFGILGEPRVNVLKLNLALDAKAQ